MHFRQRSQSVAGYQSDLFLLHLHLLSDASQAPAVELINSHRTAGAGPN